MTFPILHSGKARSIIETFNFMRYTVIVLYLLTTQALFGQSTTDADKVRQTLQGASISRLIVKTRILFFSNLMNKDTIVLIVPVGLISQSASSLKIRTHDNRTIFDESIKTHYFIRGIFEPDSIPTGRQSDYEANEDKYIVSLTKAKFEEFAKSKINSFLKDVTVSKTELNQVKTNGTITDKELYKNIFENSNPKVIWFPCFTCDEGARYFAYSTRLAKATEFLVTD